MTPTLFQSVLASNHVFLHFRFLSLAVIVVYYFSYDEVALVCIQLMKQCALLCMENFRLMYVALSQDLDINAEQLPRLATQNSFNFGLDLARVLVIVF